MAKDEASPPGDTPPDRLSLDPRSDAYDEAVLSRGYAIVSKPGGEIVADAGELAKGDRIAVTFAHGSADATVSDVRLK